MEGEGLNKRPPILVDNESISSRRRLVIKALTYIYIYIYIIHKMGLLNEKVPSHGSS